LRENIEKFRKYYDRFLALMSTLFLYLYLLVVLWNMGFRFDLLQLLTPMLGVLFYFMGVLAENAKKNWSIGVRTPWTLTSEIVWDKTNRIFGRLFRVAGVVVVFGLLFPGYALLFMLIPALLVTVFSIIYSYVEYQKQLN
ncbi:MAG: SdpI family protein, partial [Candidatus Bathyarchaeota archaeon]|nr:SdpI family protein [Candidatus Bathyarchaeota archaeon]